MERRERDKIVELHGTNRQRAEESMLSSKAKLMAQTVDSGTIDQVKEQLSLLSQFKDSYVKVQNRIHGQQGEDDFDQTAHDLFFGATISEEAAHRRKWVNFRNFKPCRFPDDKWQHVVDLKLSLVVSQ